MNQRERRIAAVAALDGLDCSYTTGALSPEDVGAVVDAVERADAAAPEPTVDLVLDVVLARHDIPDFRIPKIRADLAGVLAGRDPWTPGDTPPASGWWIAHQETGRSTISLYIQPDSEGTAPYPPGWQVDGYYGRVVAWMPLPPAFVPGGAL